MAMFGRATFNAVSYAASRPTYPRALFDYVFRFHAAGGGRWDTAVDLGCGTGQATVELTPFKTIFGVDPSAGMIDTARRALASESGRIAYIQSPAESLAFLEDESVDMMTSAQAGHWFDWSRMWPEAARVLRQNGTFAVWIYSELRFPRYPTLTPLLTHFFQGTDPETSIGPYWQQPGRSILEGHLIAVPDARDVVPGAFDAFSRVYFTGGYHPHLPSPRPIVMRKRMTWEDVYAYVCTSSALYTFLERYPEDAGHPEGDLAMRFWRALMRGAAEAEGVVMPPEEEVEVEWPLAIGAQVSAFHMATFGEISFNAAVYAASRPTYPQALYDFIFDVHRRSPDARFERAVDLGCGTGQATVELRPFKHVTGVDPSENMIRSAHTRAAAPAGDGDRPEGPIIDFVQGSAERLDFLEDGGTDLVIAAQAAHWFDWSKTWPELARVMRKGATAAFWIYSEFRLPQYPSLTPLIVAYDTGTDPNTSLGPYWQQPGRSVLNDHLVGIPEGKDVVPGAFEPLERVYFTGTYFPDLPSPRPIVLRKSLSWEDFLGYLGTWSALHTFKARHPEDAVHPDGSLEVRFWRALREGAARESGDVSDWVEVEWPVAMVVVRKAV